MEKSKPVFEGLEIFIGNWEMEASKDKVPLARAKTSFKWFENKAFLIQHVESEPPLPTTPQIWIDNNPNPITVVIGHDDTSRLYYYVYADARGVRRVYQMSLEDNVWKIWGMAGEKFFQRFEGKFNSDKNIITGRWESSENEKNWESDFDVKYERI